jgi:hypothetical protein
MVESFEVDKNLVVLKRNTNVLVHRWRGFIRNDGNRK